MKLQLRGKRFPGYFVRSIFPGFPRMALVCERSSDAQVFRNRQSALEAWAVWGGDVEEIEVV